MCFRAVVIAAETAVGAGGLGDGCGFAGEAIEHGRSACGGGGDGWGEGSEEFGVGLRWCDGCLDVFLLLLYDLQPARQWASW